MATEIKVTVPDDLRQALDAAAQADGKTAEEWLTDAIRARLQDRQWQETVSQVRSYMGVVSEAEVEAKIDDYREQHSIRRGRR